MRPHAIRTLGPVRGATLAIRVRDNDCAQDATAIEFVPAATTSATDPHLKASTILIDDWRHTMMTAKRWRLYYFNRKLEHSLSDVHAASARARQQPQPIPEHHKTSECLLVQSTHAVPINGKRVKQSCANDSPFKEIRHSKVAPASHRRVRWLCESSSHSNDTTS